MKSTAREHWLLPDAPYESYAQYLDDTGESVVERVRRTDPDDALAEIERSGLRGRGGAGFPTGVKWRTLAAHPCTTRYVVCNGAEGEPGTFKDRALLRRNPYACLEGMLIAAHVIGAREAIIGVKGSFELEIERLESALAELRQSGVLAHVAVRVVPGPGEYLFGEEKALLNFIEDGLPMPRSADEPPYERGLFGSPSSPNPALVNNVETFSHVPSILRSGAESFRRLGSSDTPGTVIFTISGDVRRPGVYELEAGTTLREILYEVAGGPRGERFKAILSGVSNAPILPDKLDTPADFGSLALIGSGLGSAGFVALGETRSIPRVAQAVARFLYVESCNQCSACKHGLRMASSAIDELFDPAEATPDDPPRAVFGAQSAPQGNRCYLPVQGSILIPSLLERFADEVAAQLAHPAAPSEPFAIPLLTDFDEERGEFLYDESFARKRPDWSYDPPVERAPSTPSEHSSGPVGVRLTPEVVRALEERAMADGKAIDVTANRLLRVALGLGDEDGP